MPIVAGTEGTTGIYFGAVRFLKIHSDQSHLAAAEFGKDVYFLQKKWQVAAEMQGWDFSNYSQGT